MCVIKTEKLSKIFVSAFRKNRVEAVKLLDLSVKKGEVFGLLGPNGSGKSTTAKMILGLLSPSSGKITVLGSSPDNVKIKARIGFLPEETYLYKFLNSEETLHFFGKIFNMPRKQRVKRIDELLNIVGLEYAKKRPVREYSKGMQRRLGFAQALINDPELLILDEPTSGLDPIGTAEMKQLILNLKDEGKSILMNSHLLGDVEEICSRIAILYKGELLASGEIKDLLAQEKKLSAEFTPSSKNTDIEKMHKNILDFAKKNKIDVKKLDVSRDTLSHYFLRLIHKRNPDELPESLRNLPLTDAVDADKSENAIETK